MKYPIVKICLLFSLLSADLCYSYEIINLTQDLSSYNRNPKSDGNMVAWETNSGIYFYNGNSSQCISSFFSYLGGISGDHVAFNSGSSWSSNPYHYYNGTTSPLLVDSLHHSPPDVCGDLVAWQGKGTSAQTDYEVLMFDGQQVKQLTNDNYEDFHVRVGDGIITWTKRVPQPSGFSKRILYKYDVASDTTEVLGEGFLKIDGRTCAWGEGSTIQVNDDSGTWQLTESPIPSMHLNMSVIDISGSYIAWAENNMFDDTTSIKIYDGQEIHIFMENINLDKITACRVDNGKIAWIDNDSSSLFFQDLATGYTELIASGDMMSLNFSDNNIVWEQHQNNRYDIMMVTIPEPATLSLLAFGTMLATGRRRIRIMRSNNGLL